MSKESSNGHGISTLGLLGVAFIMLKLCGVIEWSWLWVLAPFWVPLAIALAILPLFFVLYIREHRKNKKEVDSFIQRLRERNGTSSYRREDSKPS